MKHILLIDDSEEDNEFHELAIAEAGIDCTVSVNTSAEAGLKFLENSLEDLPGLIFIDAMMPRINGFELVEKINNLLKSKNVPPDNVPAIYLLSGSYNPALEKIMQNNDYGVLVKGYRIKPLTAAMVKAIANG